MEITVWYPECCGCMSLFYGNQQHKNEGWYINQVLKRKRKATLDILIS